MNLWKPILAALVIFAAGVVTGGLTVQIQKPPLAPQPGPNPPVKRVPPMPREAQLRELSRRMQAELDLAPEQRDRVEAIIRESQERMKTFRDEVGKKIAEEFREMRLKIRSDLSPEQRKKFAEIMRQHDERDKRDSRTARPAPAAAAKPE